MATLPAQGQPISFSQIQSFVSSTYSVNSTSIRTLSNAAGKSAPDSMSEFAAIPITIWARNRFALTNPTNAITINWKISPSLGTGTWTTLSTQAIGTTYVNMGTILVDPGQISTTNRFRIGPQFTQSGGGIVNVQFGESINGTNWTFYCGSNSAPYTLSSVTASTDIYLNINISSGQYVPCG